MPYTKQTWTDEVPASTPVKYSITGDVEGEISASAAIAVVTSITTPGSPVNATRLNYMEEGIETAQETAEAAIPKSIATAAGQLLRATGSGAWEVVSLSDITYPAHAKLTTGQTISFNTNTVVPWGSEVFDPKGVFTTGAAAKYTAPIAGYYKVDCFIEFTGTDSSTGTYTMYLYKNGALDAIISLYRSSTTTVSNFPLVGSKIIQLALNDYIQIYVHHNDNSGTVQVSDKSFVSISRIG